MALMLFWQESLGSLTPNGCTLAEAILLAQTWDSDFIGKAEHFARDSELKGACSRNGKNRTLRHHFFSLRV